MRMSSIAFLPLLVLAASAYNVHQGAPAISASGLEGTGQLFGFSVALHKFSDGSTVNLVGAPKVFVNSSQRTEGGVYVCPTANGSVCYREPLFNSRADPLGSSDPFLDHVADHPDAHFDGQLLGYTLRSFEHHVVSCAPLFQGTDTGGIPDYTGRCVVFPHDFNDSDIPDQITPGILASSGAIVDGLLMGVGLALLSDDSTSSAIALGYGRSGTVAGGVVYKVMDTRNALSVNGYLRGSPTFDDLLGYHVQVGHVTSISSYDAIVGAPRGNQHLGNVFVTDFSQTTPLFTISGKQSNGHFGHSFAVCNLMSEGYDSIVVGCPLCDNDVGRVYVYRHSGTPAQPYLPSAQEVTPPSIAAGRFGLVVTNAGDLDKDGYDDVAIAAPHDGGGVVYIYRGCELGLFNSPQVIRPSAQTYLFGYKLSASVDIDNNSYPDLSVTDMSGTVYTFRTNPLVVVDAWFEGFYPTVNINSDVCTIASFSAVCFNFSLCFRYNPLVEGADVNKFALSYSLSVDQSLARVLQMTTLPMSSQLTLNTNTSTCTEKYVFFLKPDSTDTTSAIAVQLTLQDVPIPLALPPTPLSAQLGGPLTPLLSRYIVGSQPRKHINGSVSLVADCVAEGNCASYVLRVKKEGPEKVSISNKPFTVDVSIENTANQSGITPQLFIDVPPGVGIYGQNSNVTSIVGVQACVPVTTVQFKCSLSLIHSFSFLNLTIPFIMDPTIFGVTLLSQSSLPTYTMNFTVGQNYSLSGFKSSLLLAFDARAEYTVTSSTNEAEYVAFSLVSPSLTGQGPVVKYTVKVTNSLSDGTTIPNTTLFIYWPTYFISSKGPLPLLVALTDSSPTASCRHYNTVPQQALNFNVTLPQQRNDSSPPLPTSYSPQRDSFVYGVVVCDIQNLARETSADVIVLGQLWSTSVQAPIMPHIDAVVRSGTLLPNIIGGKPFDKVTILLSPGVKEFAVACFPIWIIIVAVIAGFLCLGVVGMLLGCVLLLWRFFRKHASYDMNTDIPDNDDDFESKEPRILPPIGDPIGGDGTGGVTDSRQTDTATSYQYHPILKGRTPSNDTEAAMREKDKEMEEELRLQAQLTNTMTRPLVKHPQPKEPSEAPSDDPNETTL